jgi:hypothetical protein
VSGPEADVAGAASRVVALAAELTAAMAGDDG